MKQEKQDRRSRRTRRLVNNALLELLFEKRYDAITVQDILDRAEIGRSTFYTHYFDKEDVLAAMAEQMLETFALDITRSGTEQQLVPSLALFQHIQEHARHFQALLRGHAGETVWEASQTTLSKSIEQTLVGSRAPESLAIPPALVARYLAGAFVTIVKWWLEADMPYTPEEIDRIFQQLALPGVWTIVELFQNTPRGSTAGSTWPSN